MVNFFLEIAGSAKLYYKWGKYLKKTKRDTIAMEALKKSLEINNTYVKAHKLLASYCKSSGFFEEAISHYRSILQEKPLKYK